MLPLPWGMLSLYGGQDVPHISRPMCYQRGTGSSCRYQVRLRSTLTGSGAIAQVTAILGGKAETSLKLNAALEGGDKG